MPNPKQIQYRFSPGILGLKKNFFSVICVDQGIILKLLESLNSSKAVGIGGLQVDS